MPVTGRIIHCMHWFQMSLGTIKNLVSRIATESDRPKTMHRMTTAEQFLHTYILPLTIENLYLGLGRADIWCLSYGKFLCGQEG